LAVAVYSRYIGVNTHDVRFLSFLPGASMLLGCCLWLNKLCVAGYAAFKRHNPY